MQKGTFSALIEIRTAAGQYFDRDIVFKVEGDYFVTYPEVLTAI